MSDDYDVNLVENGDGWTLFLRSGDAAVCVTVIDHPTAFELHRQLGEALKPKPPKVTVHFAGGPWHGQHTDVDMATAPLFAPGHSVGGHYWLDTKSGDLPTYHWDGHEMKATDAEASS